MDERPAFMRHPDFPRNQTLSNGLQAASDHLAMSPWYAGRLRAASKAVYVNDFALAEVILIHARLDGLVPLPRSEVAEWLEKQDRWPAGTPWAPLGHRAAPGGPGRPRPRTFRSR